MLKHVYFFCLQFSGVDLIEHLKQHENVEEDAVMFTSLIVPIFNLNGWWNSENFRAFDK